MDPNSKNQTWSKWLFVVFPGVIKERPFKEVVENCARFGEKGFGTASEMRVRKMGSNYVIEVLTEGHPIQEQSYVDYMRDSWTKFFVNGFGTGTKVKMKARLMAGEPHTGGPAEQLIIMPSLIKAQEK